MPSPEDSAPAGTWASRLGRVELLALVACALVALAFHARLPGRLPSEADYRELAKVLQAERADGDVLLLSPWWAERARLFAPAELPVVGYLGSDGDPLQRHRRIWVLAQPGLPGADPRGFEAAFSPGRTRVGAPRRFGPLELSLFENGRSRPTLLSAAEAVAAARVWVEGPSGRADCRFDGQAHRCPGGQHVAAEWHEVKFQPRRCLWMTPPGGPSRLVVELPAAPAGATVQLEAGFVWDRGFFHSAQLTPAELSVDGPTGGRLIDLALAPGLEGLQRAEAPLPEAGPLRLTLQSQNPELRELCVDLFAFGAVEAASR